MKKQVRILLFLLLFLVVSYQILALFGVFIVYKNPTTANEPNLKYNSKFVASNLVKPSLGDFICFTDDDKEFGEMIKVFRLCGLENDIVELKNGTLFVNGVNFDKNLSLIHFYKVDKNTFNFLEEASLINTELVNNRLDKDEYVVSIEDKIATKQKIIENRMIDMQRDNFGPIKVPLNSFFVLGDNRDNSIDSRDFGFISRENVLGVVVYNN